MHTQILSEKLKEGDHLGNLGVGGRMELKHPKLSIE
jgi:hypothetical protein